MTRRRDERPPEVRIEAENEWAWCGERRLELTPKTFAVLRHLVEQAERLVTKDQLLAAVWTDTVVSEASLTSCIRDLRRALEDSSHAPRYIQTVHRRGFRFIGPIGSPRLSPTSRDLQGVPRSDRPVPQLVGRDVELARLHAVFETALGGRRRVVFVTGEPGIGKTTLVEAFLAQLDPGAGLRIARGQCVEQYGAGEAYLPVLEALGRMGRGPGADALVQVLRQYAPTWLAQLSALLGDADLEAVQRRAQGSTRERMLRELIDALDAVSAESPLVLVLEDLHWSDSATIDLIAMLARRPDPARLLVVATYRPADVAAHAHPLKPVKQELQLHGHCEELALDFLGEEAVGDYLAARLPGSSFPPAFVRILHRNTSGNPLFLVNLIDHLIARGHVHDADGRWQLAVAVADVASDVPNTLWQMVDKQLERLAPPEQAMLAVASVAGADFSSALASVDGIDPDDAERCCAALARRGQLIRALGAVEWPDGTVAEHYAFIHALYQNVLYERVPVGRRVGLHARIGARLERAHGARAGEIAGELAVHFERGRDFVRAVQYQRQAAANALRRHAHREAASHATRALDLLEAFPESPEHLQQELAIHTMLGAALTPQGSTTPEVERTYARARELSTRIGASPEILPAVVGLFRYHLSRAELRSAGEVVDQLTTLSAARPEPAVLLGAHYAAGMVAFYAGDYATALAQVERGIAVDDRARHDPARGPGLWGGLHAGVCCAVYAAWTLWVLGHPARAVARMQDALDRARFDGHPFAVSWACTFAAGLHACRRDVDAVRALTDATVPIATEHGFELLRNLGTAFRGWVRRETGEPADGTEELRAGVAAFREHGGGIGLPTFLGLLADAYGACERRDDGLGVLADALAMSKASGAHYWDAELLRLRGALLLGSHTPSRRGGARSEHAAAERNAESSFTAAVELARRQHAKSLELRAATSLGRLLQTQGKGRQAHALLSEIYGGFDEGFDAADLRDAKAVLDGIARAPER